MPAPKSKGQTFVFEPYDTIGAVDAEEDSSFLEDCYVETGSLERLRDIRSTQRLVVGRTGSGKSALLMTLAKRARSVRIDPELLAIQHLSSSNLVRYLTEEVGISMAPFYKLLWTHCFCAEIVQSELVSKQQKRFKVWPAKHSIDPQIRKFLDQFGEKEFFLPLEERLRVVLEQTENKLQVALGKDKTHLSGDRKLAKEERSELHARVMPVIESIHGQMAAKVLRALNELLVDPQKAYFVLVDNLDEHWVDDRIRCDLIWAIIETSRQFRHVKHVKVVIALREDLLERVIAVSAPETQKEKLESMKLELKWTKAHLRQLLDERISRVYRDRYAKRSRVVAQAALGHLAVHGEPALDYMLARTQQRPRDVICFFNEVIRASEGVAITQASIKKAEKTYSEGRLQSIQDEWGRLYPGIKRLAQVLLDQRPSTFAFAEIDAEVVKDKCADFALMYTDHPQTMVDVADGRYSAGAFVQTTVAALVRVGLLTVKFHPNDAAISERSINAELLTGESKLTIHPAFHRALHVQP